MFLKKSPNQNISLGKHFFNMARAFERWLRPLRQANSVTWCGENSPLWQFFNILLLIYQNTMPSLANLWHHWANFTVANGQLLENNLTICSHCRQVKLAILSTQIEYQISLSLNLLFHFYINLFSYLYFSFSTVKIITSPLD